MSQTQRLIEITAHLPAQALAEVIDFAEFIAEKQEKMAAISLDDLIGSLKEDSAFADRDPLEIQNEMRDEWAR